MEATIEQAVKVFLANTKADQNAMLAALVDEGFTSCQAWRLYQFLPIAFTHVAFRDAGVTFAPHYDVTGPGSSLRSSHLANEPLYVAGVQAAERMIEEGHSPRELWPVFALSSEYAVLLKLSRPDGSVEGIVLSAPLLNEFEG